MSGPSGFSSVGGKNRGPGGKGREGLQLLSGRQEDLAVMLRPALFRQEGQLKESMFEGPLQ